MTHDPPIEQQIVAAIRKIVRAVDLHSRRLVDAHGLTGPQLATLHAARRIGPAPASAVARAVHLSQPTITGILSRLQQRGLISRTPSEIDRRATLIAITPEGERVLDTAPSLLQDRFRTELSRLPSWERHQILATLQRVATLMDAESIDASPHLTTDDPLHGERSEDEPGPRSTPPSREPAA